jgi:hypothetical protein
MHKWLEALAIQVQHTPSAVGVRVAPAAKRQRTEQSIPNTVRERVLNEW